MGEVITASILFLISAGLFVMSVFSFREKGFLFNNAYIYASKQERETMHKAAHYRQSAIVFLLLGILFMLSGIGLLLRMNWIFGIAGVVLVSTLIYAVVSSIRIG